MSAQKKKKAVKTKRPPVKSRKPASKPSGKSKPPRKGPAAKKKPAVKSPPKKPQEKKKPTSKPASVKPVALIPRSSSSEALHARMPSKPKPAKTLIDDLPLDMEEKEDLAAEEKEDVEKALRDGEDEALETAFVPTDTSERYILVVDEEGQRRNESVLIISQILPNAIIEVADDPEEAQEMMQDCEFDTYVVNFLMPGYSASPFVKDVANHPDHPLLIGFAADKISDAVDPKKGLKIIPLKRLFDLDASTLAEPVENQGNLGRGGKRID